MLIINTAWYYTYIYDCDCLLWHVWCIDLYVVVVLIMHGTLGIGALQLLCACVHLLICIAESHVHVWASIFTIISLFSDVWARSLLYIYIFACGNSLHFAAYCSVRCRAYCSSIVLCIIALYCKSSLIAHKLPYRVVNIMLLLLEYLCLVLIFITLFIYPLLWLYYLSN